MTHTRALGGFWVSTLALSLSFGVSVQAQPAADQAAAPAAAQAGTPAASDAVPIEQRLRAHVGKAGGLTSEQVAQRAATTSLEAELAALDAQSARADRNQVTATSLPRLELLARYTRLSPVDEATFGPDSGSIVVTDQEGPLAPGTPLFGVPASTFSFPQVLNQYHLQASLRVPLSDYVFRLSNAYSAVGKAERAAELNKKAAELSARARAKAAYYDWVQAVLQTAVAEQSLAQSEASLVRTQTAFQVGRISQADVLSAKSVVANARLLVEQARSRARIAEQNVRVITHDDSGEPYTIGEDILTPPPGNARDQEFDVLYREAEQRRLELKALEANISAIESQRDVIEANGLPRLEAFGNVYYSRPNQRFIPQQDEWRASWDVGIQMTWSPNDLGSSSAEATKFEIQRRQALLQRQQIKDALRREVMQSHAMLQEAQIALTSARASVQAAEEGYAVQRTLYENGRGTTLELLQAESQLLQARVTLVNTLVMLRLARVSLDHAIGRDVPTSMR